MKGGYRNDLLLGTGGMAEVWRAIGSDGPVAIKRLLPHAARDASMAAAFEREGRVLERIRHPNIIGILETGRDSQGPYIVLEYVDGVPLRKLLGEPVPPRLALRVARDVLSGLEVVHGLRDESGRSLGFLHRDLSPSNVLLSATGDVKVADFGIARAMSGSDATTGNTIRGTLAYMSPEQACGLPVDARSDLFAVGSLLYEMLLGRPVYEDADPRLALARARAAEIRGLGEVCPTLPRDVVELVDCALAAAPADRLPSAEAMRMEVERVAERTYGLAYPEEVARWVECASRPPPPTQSVMSSSNRARIGIGIGAAGLLVAALVLFGTRKISRASGVLPIPSPTSSAAPVPEPAASTPAPENDTPDVSEAPSATKHVVAAPRYGWLDIGSEPAFAYVTIDGKPQGSTPLFGRKLVAGRHRIEVSRKGLGTKTFFMDVKAGDHVSRVVHLP